MSRPGGGAQGGLSGDQLGGSCFHAFRQALAGAGVESAEWEATDESHQAGFMAASAWLEGFFGADDQDEGGSWKALAAETYLQFCRAASETPLPLEQIPPATLLAWEAFARHASNMLVFDADDGDGDVEAHEAFWRDWAKERTARSQMPEAEAAARRPYEGD